LNIKQTLFAEATNQLEAKMQVAYYAMQAAQASANEEGKSSAGDKYETARAMGQIERDMHARQYEKLRIERQVLDRIDPEKSFVRVALGALVQTSTGWFWVAVSLGAMIVQEQQVMVVSVSSPIGSALMGKEVGHSFIFQQKNCIIEAVF
jgi:transcription elongation GreA/GreB family factor